jgi:hypothetical protein
MPSAQVLQAFLDRIARKNLMIPPDFRAARSEYQIAGQPPPRTNRRLPIIVLPTLALSKTRF